MSTVLPFHTFCGLLILNGNEEVLRHWLLFYFIINIIVWSNASGAKGTLPRAWKIQTKIFKSYKSDKESPLFISFFETVPPPHTNTHRHTHFVFRFALLRIACAVLNLIYFDIKWNSCDLMLQDLTE